ncbi:MAG: hypothetical protein HY549_01815 [Elusimicrobia bacterium]|nr:hypothetical protein [Elusimicrobiota bacterium]
MARQGPFIIRLEAAIQLRRRPIIRQGVLPSVESFPGSSSDREGLGALSIEAYRLVGLLERLLVALERRERGSKSNA